MFKKKKNNFSRGGYQQYRSPSVFGSQSKNKRQPIKISKGIWKIILAILLAAGFIYLFFFSKIFIISDVFVEGNSMVSTESISNLVPKGSNIFRLNETNVKNDILKAWPEIKTVEIYLGIPNAIKIVVLERQGKIVWQSNNQKYLISSQGDVAKLLSDGEFGDLPIVIDNKNIPVQPGMPIVSQNFVAFIININETFFTETNIKLSRFEITDTTFDVNVYTEAGFYVKFNSLRSSKKQLENLKIVLASKRQDIREYVDLRIDGWAYYK